jgi:hypothetical protein
MGAEERVMSLPKIKYGSISVTRTVTDKIHENSVVATSSVVQEKHLIKYSQISKVPEILIALYSDEFKLKPKAYTEELQSNKGGFFLVTEYTELGTE